MKYFDIHSHLNFDVYDSDFDEVLYRLETTDTHTITVGTDLESSKRAVELADKHERIYACIGVHPVPEQARYGAGPDFDEEEFEKLVKHPKVVAVGETGLDFFHSKKEEDYERQKELFLKHAEFARKHDLPLMIHTREAYTELLEILESLGNLVPKLRGNVHFFAGTVEEAKRFLDIGFTLSFTGVITFTHDYDEVIRSVPLEMIMAETDAPYVAPTPHRGKRNEPSYVQEVAKKIAEIRGEDSEVVREALVQNALRMIG